MIKLTELYNKSQIPVNEEILNKLIEKYSSIPFSSLNVYEKRLSNYKMHCKYGVFSIL